MAINLFIRTDNGYGPRVVGGAFSITVAKFPQPAAPLLVMTQLLNDSAVQEVQRSLTADLGPELDGCSFQPLESYLGLPVVGSSEKYHSLGVAFTLLPLGTGTNTVRLRCLDGATTGSMSATASNRVVLEAGPERAASDSIPLYRETIAVPRPRWNGGRPRWDAVCVSSGGVTGWHNGELPARWHARHRGLLIDVLQLDRPVDRLRLATVPLDRPVLFDAFAATALPGWRQDIRRTGGRVLISVDDDFWNIPSWIPKDPADPSGQLHRADVARIERSLREADALVVHSARMADRVERFNRSIRVIPHALPPLDELPSPRARAAAGARIGWVGCPSHHGDLDMIAPAVFELLARHADVTFVLAGPNFPSWAVTATAARQIELHPGWVPLPAYYRWISSLDLDVFITPVVDHPFNASKPPLKPLEAAGLGIPVIASAVGSYREALRHEETALLVENTTEAWLAALRRVVADADLRRRLAAGGRAWAATQTVDQLGPRWAELWER